LKRSDFLSQQIKDLTKNVQILLKKKTQQFMLGRVLTRPEFLPFLSGEKTIRVFTPQKHMFKALLRVDDATSSSFHLEPRGVIPSGVDAGTVLLLVFDSDKESYIVQCVVGAFSFLTISIKGLDPRTSARRLTLLPATFFNVSDEFFKKITKEEVVIRRIAQNPEGEAPVDKQLCKDVFFDALSSDGKEINIQELFNNDSNKLVGLLTDISSGGCCIQLNKKSASWRREMFQFGIVQFEIPIGDGRGGSIAALIRDVRMSKGSAILHCMFLEPLPTDFLTL
jgi:hypothetical protein